MKSGAEKVISFVSCSVFRVFLCFVFGLRKAPSVGKVSKSLTIPRGVTRFS